jgi:type II secretory pathway component GspD/PulD (secretin)
VNRVFVAFVFAASCFASAAAQQLVTIDVRDADIGDVIALLSAESGKNIVADGSVKPQKVTLTLRNVSLDDALSVLASAYDLQVRRERGILVLGSSESMNRHYVSASGGAGAETVVLGVQHSKPDDVAKEIGDALPPGTVIVADATTDRIVVSGDAQTVSRARQLVSALDAPASGGAQGSATQAYRLQYVKAEDAVKQLKSLAPDGTYLADDEQNSVVVSGNGAVQEATRSLFASIDRPSPQVLFEVKVADVTPRNDSSNVGLEFGGTNLQGQQTPGQTSYAFTGGVIPVNVELNAMVSEGRAQILATPKLVTLNNREADLLIGETYPIVFNTSVLGGQNVQFVDIGVKLRLTPTIGPDGTVTAELHPEYSELQGVTSTGYPIITNRKIDSTLRVRDSETIVLGGLMSDIDSETITKVPWLSQVPVLGKFFQNREAHHERDEIVFLITPHVIYPNAVPPSR